VGVQDHECGHQEDQADVRGHQVVEAGEADLLVRVVPDHQEPGSQRGDLPAEQEHQGVFPGVDEHEGKRGHVEQRVVNADMPLAAEVAPQVAHGIDAAQQRHRQGPGEEEGAQRVKAHFERTHRVGPGLRPLHRRAREKDRQRHAQDQGKGDALRGQPGSGTPAIAHRQQADCSTRQQQRFSGEQFVHVRDRPACCDAGRQVSNMLVPSGLTQMIL
jgi:hypothetical protein